MTDDLCGSDGPLRTTMLSVVPLMHSWHCREVCCTQWTRVAGGADTACILHLVSWSSASWPVHPRQSCADGRKRKRKEKTTPFGVNLTRSLVIYQAAQSADGTTIDLSSKSCNSPMNVSSSHEALVGLGRQFQWPPWFWFIGSQISKSWYVQFMQSVITAYACMPLQHTTTPECILHVSWQA